MKKTNILCALFILSLSIQAQSIDKNENSPPKMNIKEARSFAKNTHSQLSEIQNDLLIDLKISSPDNLKQAIETDVLKPLSALKTNWAYGDIETFDPLKYFSSCLYAVESLQSIAFKLTSRSSSTPAQRQTALENAANEFQKYFDSCEAEISLSDKEITEKIKKDKQDACTVSNKTVEYDPEQGKIVVKELTDEEAKARLPDWCK